MPLESSQFSTSSDMDSDDSCLSEDSVPPSPKSGESTVILFDWDDTLCPSSHLSDKGFTLCSQMNCKDTEMELKELETSVCNLLKVAFTYGDVHIVTNAETGWVQLSAQKFIPGVMQLLSRVKVISARSTYENLFPESPLKWKYYAFQSKLATSFHTMSTSVRKNVISFGDSHVEREAVRAVTKGLSNTKTKSVKFAERPSLEQLRRQIELVINCFQYIHNHDGDLDLQLSISVNSPSSSPSPSPSHSSTPAPVSASADGSLAGQQMREQQEYDRVNNNMGTAARSSSSSAPSSSPSSAASSMQGVDEMSENNNNSSDNVVTSSTTDSNGRCTQQEQSVVC